MVIFNFVKYHFHINQWCHLQDDTNTAQLFTMCGIMLGYTKPLTYALTMTKQEDTYRYVCVCGGGV